MLLGALSGGVGGALIFLGVSGALTGLYVVLTGRRSWAWLPAKRKAGAVAMIDSLAAALRGTGVRANSVLPSIIDTPANRQAMPAADHVLATGSPAGWDAKLRASAVGAELRKMRNFKPGFGKGLWLGLANAGWETITAGLSPWRLENHDGLAVDKVGPEQPP